MHCKTSTWFANSIRNQDINVNINTKNQNILQESAAKYDYKSAIDRKNVYIMVHILINKSKLGKLNY